MLCLYPSSINTNLTFSTVRSYKAIVGTRYVTVNQLVSNSKTSISTEQTFIIDYCLTDFAMIQSEAVYILHTYVCMYTAFL